MNKKLSIIFSGVAMASLTGLLFITGGDKLKEKAKNQKSSISTQERNEYSVEKELFI